MRALKISALAALMALVTLGASCPGMSEDPAVRKIQSATVTCAGITSSINILATMRTAGQLSDSQVATVDAIIPIVEPICGVAHTSGDVIDLDALSDYLFELQKIAGGA